MRKLKAILSAACVILLLTGCGQGSETDETTITIEKDGKIVNTIKEAFNEEQYSEEALKQMTLSEVEEYNRQSGDEMITVDKIETSNNVVKVEMTYHSFQDYKEFNETEFFVGTVLEAYEAGYDMDVTLGSADGSSAQLTREGLLKLGGSTIIIFGEPVRVNTYSKILYASNGVTVSSDGKSAVAAQDTEEKNRQPAYLVLKP